MPKLYEELVDFIAQLNPEAVLCFQPSETAQKRLESLLRQHRESTLSPEEQEELEHYLLLEHLFRLAKARAREILSDAAQAV
jgi:glutamate synthase domain-containing protein 3